MSNITNLAVAREARRHQETPKSVGKGFALLHRKIMDLPFYKDPEAAHLWVHLILKAKYAPEIVMTNIGEKLVGRGQLLSGRNALAFETGLNADRVQYLLRKYKKLGMIDWVSHGKFSIFTVTKYDDYQLNSVPEDYQQITTSNPQPAQPTEQHAPADYQKITTDNELLNTYSIPNGIECASSDKKQAVQKQRLSCEEVWKSLKECVPDARGWNVLTPKRRELIQKFWREAKPIAKQFGDGEAFGMESFRTYLTYLHTSCRWMFESRPDQKTGKTWQKRNYEYILNAEIYAEVREGVRDDR